MAKVLIVEDEDNIIPDIEDALVARGDEYDRARTLEEGRTLFKAGSYAYVLLDLKIPARDGGSFPDMSYGVALLKEIRRTRSREQTPVIAMTSHHSAGFQMSTDLHVLGVNACISKPFDEKWPLLKVIEEVLSGNMTGGGASSTASMPACRSADPQPFNGGEMVFFPDRVELRGVKILTDSGAGLSRKMLELLKKKKADGRFVRMGGEQIAKAIDPSTGIGTITGCASTIRRNVKENLREHLNIECKDDDVLVRDNQGYHLNDDKITVRDEDGTGQDSARDPGPTDQGPDVPANVPGDIEVPADVPADVPGDIHLNERQAWITEQVNLGNDVRRGMVEDKFKVSAKTAKRDLSELVKRGEIEYVRTPAPGHYRRRQSHV